jgi:AraC-like DNA-binding protein
MLPAPHLLRETHLIGPNTKEWVLSSDRYPVLGKNRFVWVGYSEIRPPYRMVRLKSVHAHVVACFGGRGQTLIEGRSVEWGSGQVLLAPRGACHAFEPVGRGPWRIAWIFCDDRSGGPMVEGAQCRLIRTDALPFVTTLQMLAREAAGDADPAAMEALVALLQTHTRRLAGGHRIDPRLGSLWTQVEADLAASWNCRMLARHASISEEHLRRLCHRYYRRSPMSYVQGLRMQRAASLLRASDSKVSEIGNRIGYGSPYAFSAAFKRWCGLSPAGFRLAPSLPES